MKKRSKNKETKTCPSCKREKNRMDFHKNAARYDGRQSICKDCRRPKK